MFHTLSGATFKQVDKNSKPVGVQLPMGKTTRFCGARARSISGCLRCRKRKKKCDEVHPKCGSCKTRAEECEWPMKKQKIAAVVNENGTSVSKDTYVASSPSSLGARAIAKLRDLPRILDLSRKLDLSRTPDFSRTPDLLRPSDLSTHNSWIKRDSQIKQVSSQHDSTILQNPSSLQESSSLNEPSSLYELSADEAPRSLSKALLDATIPTPSKSNDPERHIVISSADLPPSSREKMKIDFLDNAPEDFRANEVVQELEGFREDLENFQMALEQLRLGADDAKTADGFGQSPSDVFIPTEFLAGFGFPYLFNLDNEGMMFLECYREQYSTFISIGLDTLNYFIKTFLSIAALNEGITYALTAWGGFFIELRKPRSNFTRPWQYMQKATKCMCKQMGDYLRPNDKHQFFVLFAFYLIFIGIEVCTGDVRNWRGFMTQCSLLIQSYGGILKVTDLFGFSNDIKWLISDFKFHDLLSSKCLLEGPVFAAEEYEQALLPRPEYGIDPLQGIVGPLYDIIGAMGKARAELGQKWADLDRRAGAKDPRMQELTLIYYENTQRVINEFKHKITECKPLPVHLELLQEDEQNCKFHVALFELYTHVCRIQLATSLEKLPPNCVLQQHLLHQALGILDVLQGTKFKVSLSLALLVCGMTCCTAHDRALMTQRFRLHLNQYEIGNLQRVEETVIEAWACNPMGSVCIDWAEFVRDKEWHLYVG